MFMLEVLKRLYIKCSCFDALGFSDFKVLLFLNLGKYLDKRAS